MFRIPVVLLSLLLGVSPALAQSARICLLVDETHDDKKSPAGAGEARLAEGLLAAGYALVERYDAEQARSKVSIDRMLHGDTEGLQVTGLHADVLIVARISVTTEQAPYGISYPVHAARIDLRALSVDAGRIFYANSIEGKSPGDFGAASGKVAKNLLEPLLEALKTNAAKREVLEVRVSGLKEAKAADALAVALGKVPGVKWAKVRYVSADSTMIDVAAPGMETARLEAALAAAHLVVARRSANVIEARYDETAVARRTVAVATFANRTGRPDLAWLESMLPDVFETELANSKYLEPTASAHAAIDPDHVDLAKVKAQKADVVVIGKFEKAGGQGLRLTAKAIRTSDGAILAAAQLFGTEAAVAELGKELVWKLDPPLYQKILGKSSLEGYVSPLAKNDTAPRSAQQSQADGSRVRIAEVKLGDLFPARIGYYAQRPLGKVMLRNDGKSAADDVRLEISLGDLSGGPQTIRVESIAPGKTVEVPLKLVLERKALLEVTQRRPARADMAVLQGDHRETFTEPLVLWDRNAIDWNESDSVAAFVTPKDPIVNAFAQEAARLGSVLPPSVPAAVRAAAALFDSVVALGTHYSRDALSPYGERSIDTVQFPRETLKRKVGDCDDLAVLYASLVQSIGQDAKLVLTPGHIFVAIDAELTTDHAERLGGAAKVLNLDGHAWIPVEITRLDGGFKAAWAAGLNEIGRYQGDVSKVTYVDVPHAWHTYPPFPMDAPESPPEVPADKTRKLLLVDASQLGQAMPEPVALSASATPGERLEHAIARGKRGEYEAARNELASLAEGPALTRPLRAAASNNMGNIDTLLARYDDATKDYERALADGGAAASIEHNLGVVHYMAGHGGEAKKHLQKSGSAESKKLLSTLGLASAAPKKPKVKPIAGTAPEHDTAESEGGQRAGEARLDAANNLIWMK